MNVSDCVTGLRNYSGMVFVSILFASQPALSADGVREINQACAAVGCFQNDAPGFPVQITQDGSYILTSNLDVTGESNPENVTAIEISPLADLGVIIDFNGFLIVGPTVCTGTPVDNCTPVGTGIGVDGQNHVTIRNGKIYGMADDCVNVITGGTIENMVLESCGGNGLSAGGQAIVRNNRIYRNGGNGMFTGQTSLVTGNVIRRNGEFGMSTSDYTGYGGNNFNQNGDGPASDGLQIAPNVCGFVLCP